MVDLLEDLDNPAREGELQDRIRSKVALRRLYREVYESYRDCLARCPTGGEAVELGSGGGFVKEVVPEMITSDVLPYREVDLVVDAMEMPFQDSSLRALCMVNVFHHIPDVARFLAEAQRVLVPGGRVFMVDQHIGLFSRHVYRWLHPEQFHPDATDWAFESHGPVSDANGALSMLVFKRDVLKFQSMFPRLQLAGYRPHTPLRYWLCGGLKTWTLLPGWAFPMATAVDRGLARVSSQLCSFADIELVKVEVDE